MGDFKMFVQHIEAGILAEVIICFKDNFLERPIGDEWGNLPIHIACWNGRLEIAKFLVEKKCNIECENNLKRRPIHLATVFGHLEVVKFLCENCHCDLYCENQDGQTPVQVAKRYGKKECEKYLNEILESRRRNEIVLVFQKQSAEQKEEQNREDIRNLSKRFDEKSNELEKILKRIANELDKLVKENTALKTLITKLSQVQVTQNYGEFVWCVKNWEDLNKPQDQIEQVIFSDPFYSYKNGYKMCLELNLCVDINGSGPHLSVYVCIMQGEYDCILQWPFPHGVKLELLDQESTKAHVSKIVDYKQQTSHVAWQKPTEQRNTGSGFADFIKLSELSANAALFRDNQFWIKATFLESRLHNSIPLIHSL